MTRGQDVAEIRAVVYQMAERFGAKDVESVMALWVDKGASAIGTGVDEIRFGSDAVRLQIARDVSKVDTFSFGMDNLHVDVVGDAAFAFADVEINVTFGSESMRFPVRATFGLARTKVGWRVAQAHTSVPDPQQPEGQSFPVELTKTLSDLLTSMDSAVASSDLQPKGLGTATFLFTDIVDSTALSQSMGVW